MNPYKPKIKAPHPELVSYMQNILRTHQLTTVCEAAACPNRTECYARHVATFMILGDTCTRACHFCNVKTGKGLAPDPHEPQRLANAIRELDLNYVVITSVDRDDLADYGASHFVSCVKAIRQHTPHVKIELLTPDFRADSNALDKIIALGVDKLAHNEETVQRLSPLVRPQSNYDRSLRTLAYYARYSSCVVKSSLMLGLGEKEEELIRTMQDLLDAGVKELTIGQYLQPTASHHPVQKYYDQAYFEYIRIQALQMGFDAVASGVLVRSSYYAEKL